MRGIGLEGGIDSSETTVRTVTLGTDPLSERVETDDVPLLATCPAAAPPVPNCRPPS